MRSVEETFENAWIYSGLELVYVPVPKSASTTTKTYLNALSGIKSEEGRSVHRRKVRGIQMLADLSALQFAKTVLLPSSKYTVFSIVRHPVQRFVSAYRSKILELDGAEVMSKQNTTTQWGARDIVLGVAHLRGVAPQDVSQITLEEFFKLVQGKPLGSANRHWRSQSHLLSQRVLPYDHVFRLEDIKSGACDLAGILGLEQPFPRSDRTPAPIEVSAEIQTGLETLYAKDFRSFGYS